MSDPNVVYKVSLTDKEVLAALNRIDKKIDDVADRGEKAFNGIQGSAKLSGVKIGAISGIVQELTGRFIDMGLRAIKVFADIAAESVELNKELELARISVTQIFQGNQAAADAFLESVKQSAVQLGVSRTELTQLAKGVLPDIGSIELTQQFTEAITILGRDAGQSFQSIRIAAEEALSGNLASLQRRLNIPKATLDSIERYQEEFGVAEGLVRGLQERVEKTGLSIEATADSLAVLTGQAKGAVQDIQLVFGEPIADELKQQIIDTFAVFEENREDIEAVATAFGELAAKVIEFVGGGLRDLIENLDFVQLEQTADQFAELVDSAQLLADILFDPDLLNNLLSGTNAILEALNRALVTASQITALAKAERAREQAELDVLLGEEGAARAIGGALPIGLLVAQTAVSEGQRERAAAAGQEAYNETLREAVKSFDDYNERLEENEEKSRTRREETTKSTDADLTAGEAILQRQKQLDDLAKAESEALEAQEKINEKREKLARDTQRRITKIQIDAERDRLNDQIKNAQRREDIARKNAEKIEDVFRDNAQDIEDAARDLSRDEEDIARKAARNRQEVERDTANKRVEIERDFRQELLRIQQQFEQTAEEAERNNDAQAFLRAVRTRDQQIEQAQLRRDENIESAKIEAEQRRQELKRNLEFEIEDAKIANERKLEDLQISLQRELDEQRLNLERELEEQRIAEQRQAEARQLALQQELEDFARRNAEKKADLQRSLEEELAIVQKFEKAKATLAIAEAKRAVDKIREIRNRLPLAGQSRSRQVGNPLENLFPTRQHGGPVTANQSFLVGEAGPEVFTPQQNGTIIPNPSLFSPPVQSAPLQQIRNVNSPTANFQMTDFQSMLNDPVARSLLENFVLDTFVRLGL